MKTTKNGYRISKNGNVMQYIEKEAFISEIYLGNVIKHEGTYYFFNKKQGDTFIYLP